MISLRSLSARLHSDLLATYPLCDVGGMSYTFCDVAKIGSEVTPADADSLLRRIAKLDDLLAAVSSPQPFSSRRLSSILTKARAIITKARAAAVAALSALPDVGLTLTVGGESRPISKYSSYIARPIPSDLRSIDQMIRQLQQLSAAVDSALAEDPSSRTLLSELYTATEIKLASLYAMREARVIAARSTADLPDRPLTEEEEISQNLIELFVKSGITRPHPDQINKLISKDRERYYNFIGERDPLTLTAEEHSALILKELSHNKTFPPPANLIARLVPGDRSMYYFRVRQPDPALSPKEDSLLMRSFLMSRDGKPAPADLLLRLTPVDRFVYEFDSSLPAFIRPATRGFAYFISCLPRMIVTALDKIFGCAINIVIYFFREALAFPKLTGFVISIALLYCISSYIESGFSKSVKFVSEVWNPPPSSYTAIELLKKVFALNMRASSGGNRILYTNWYDASVDSRDKNKIIVTFEVSGSVYLMPSFDKPHAQFACVEYVDTEKVTSCGYVHLN